MNTYEIKGSEFVKGEVKGHGKSGAHIYLPKEWTGSEVVVIRDGSVERMEKAKDMRIPKDVIEKVMSMDAEEIKKSVLDGIGVAEKVYGVKEAEEE